MKHGALEHQAAGEDFGAVEPLMAGAFQTQRLFGTGKSRRLPPDIIKRAAMRLTQLHAAADMDDLRIPPSNRLEALTGDLRGKWSIRINDRWRLCFRFESGHAHDVGIVDYH